MAEFCSCGSLVITGKCTNKNCTQKSALKQVSMKQSASDGSAKEPKVKRTRRSSKCLVYNLYEEKEESGL